jgi:hypothetical protein
VLIRVSAKTIDQAALVALAALVLTYSVVIGDAASPSAGWAWLGVAAILLGANAARLNIGARPSERLNTCAAARHRDRCGGDAADRCVHGRGFNRIP